MKKITKIQLVNKINILFLEGLNLPIIVKNSLKRLKLAILTKKLLIIVTCHGLVSHGKQAQGLKISKIIKNNIDYWQINSYKNKIIEKKKIKWLIILDA